MPVYVFTSKDGSVSTERFFPMDEKPQKVRCRGKWCYPDLRRTHAPVRARHGDLWPRWSDAAGVHPGQIKEAMEADRRLGVTAEYDEDGRVKFDSRGHEKRYLQAHGMYHLNSYGGMDADRDRANEHIRNCEAQQSEVFDG